MTSKYILSIQNNLVKFIKTEFSHGAIQDALQNKEYEDIFKSFNHEVAPLFEIQNIINNIKKEYSSEDGSLFDKFNNYVIFANHLTKIGRIKQYGDIKRQTNTQALISFFETNLKQVEDFFELYINNITSRDKHNNRVKSISIDYQKLHKDFKIPIKETYLKIIFYELFFNTFKYGYGENRTITIESLGNNSRLLIKNDVNGTCKIHGNRIALNNIKYLLNMIKYDIEPYFLNNEFIVEIKEKV